MSIVVFDPDGTEDVDFKDRMRHPAAAVPAGGMWMSGTGAELLSRVPTEDDFLSGENR
ncbi:MAG TPA: hypothetical protein VGN97_16380 [Mesorhizobium sp.]|jgi:hypothetical protein|nr:hypothetical protein [Mesorhizobium sp.]